MNIVRKTIYLGIGLFFGLSMITGQVPDITPNKVVPTPQQVAWQQMELIGFVHFTVNTFTDKEWGEGSEKESVFNPTKLDASQWVRVAKEAGMKELILTAKHHDGFCLWPSKYTEHSVKNSPWRNGKGDVVKEFTDACRKYGIKPGLYLSPWDRNSADYGKPAYLTYYRNQLTELLTHYGKIYEIWFDGANGGTGYYGGANEKREIDRRTYYDWATTWALVRRLQPDAMMFSDAGPDVRWIGNESGFAGETCWSTINADSIMPGQADAAYLNTGDPNGNRWITGECDVSIRPGWFYHASEDAKVKTPKQLVDLYYKSVGRNSLLLLNIPPDREGLIAEPDIRSLKEFRSILDETFKTDLAKGAPVKASNVRLNNKKFAPGNITDNDKTNYWAADDSVKSAWLEVTLPAGTTFDRIMLQEPIRFGQRIEEFEVQALLDNQFKTIATGTTIGYKRLLRIAPVTTTRVRIILKKSNNTPALSAFGLFKASSRE